MTPKQEKLIKDYISECKADKETKEKTAFMLPGFIRSLATQSDDFELRQMASDEKRIKAFVNNAWR